MSTLSSLLATLTQRTSGGGSLSTDSERRAFTVSVAADISSILGQLNLVYHELAQNLTEDSVDKGLSGNVIYTHVTATQDSDTAYWDSSNSRARTIKESFDVILSELVSLENQISRDFSFTPYDDTALQAQASTNTSNITQLKLDAMGDNYTLDGDANANLSYSLSQHIDAIGAFFSGFPTTGNTYTPTYPTLSLSVPSGSGGDNQVVRWNGTTDIQSSVVYLDDTGNFSTLGVTDSGANPGTSNTSLQTGARVVNDALGSPGSGNLLLKTGNTDCSDASGTGGNAGDISLVAGEAFSAAGTSGNGGNITLFAGNSADAAGGNIEFTPGLGSTANGIARFYASTVRLDDPASTDSSVLSFADAYHVQYTSSTVYFGDPTTLSGSYAAIASETPPVKLATRAIQCTDTGYGPNSGMIILETGSTDTNNASGTGGTSGSLSIATGAAFSTLGTSGSSGSINIFSGTSVDAASGNVAIFSSAGNTTSGNIAIYSGTAATVNSGSFSIATGNATAGNSGSITLTTGTAGGTRGQTTVSARALIGTLDDAIQITCATTGGDSHISGGNSVSLSINGATGGVQLYKSSSLYINATDSNSIEIGTTSGGDIQTNGTDFRRVLLTEEFHQAPEINANIGNNTANKSWQLTPASTGTAILYGNGGIFLSTTASTNDFVLVEPHKDASQSAWYTTNWDFTKTLVFKCLIRTHTVTTYQRIEVGIRSVTTAFDDITDNDKLILRYDSSDATTSSTNWVVVSSDGGSDSIQDTGVAVTASTDYFIQMVTNSSGSVTLYINESKISLTGFTAGAPVTAVWPYAGIQALAASKRDLRLFKFALSQTIY